MIFGTTNFTFDHVTYSHQETTTDEAVNYLFALVALLSMLLGVVCNVAVLYYNTAVNSKTVASIIYRSDYFRALIIQARSDNFSKFIRDLFSPVCQLTRLIRTYTIHTELH